MLPSPREKAAEFPINGGYGHLQYRPLGWQPIPADRAVRVDVEKIT
jgi:hypothetical protein